MPRASCVLNGKKKASVTGFELAIPFVGFCFFYVPLNIHQIAWMPPFWSVFQHSVLNQGPGDEAQNHPDLEQTNFHLSITAY